MKKKALAGALAVLASLAVAPAAMAADEPTVCTGTLSNKVLGDVVVEYGESCTLSRVVVLGNIEGGSYANAIVIDRSTVSGDVSAPLADSLTITGSAIGGGLSTTEISGPDGVTIARSAVVGDVAIDYTVTGPVTLGTGSVFGGAVSLYGNAAGGTISRSVFGSGLTLTANSGAFDVTRNVVRGNLDCQDNAPAPAGGRNLAGAKLGQCSAL